MSTLNGQCNRTIHSDSLSVVDMVNREMFKIEDTMKIAYRGTSATWFHMVYFGDRFLHIVIFKRWYRIDW